MIAQTDKTCVADCTDEEIVAAVDRGDGCGGRAYVICYRLGLNSTPDFRAMHRRLCKLQKAGRVERDERRSSCNSIYWRLPSEARAQC